MGVAMLSLGTAMMIWPAMGRGSILQVLLSVMPATVASLMFMTLGMSRLFALVANGASLVIGPRLRAAVAMVASMVWTTFTFSMAEVSIKQGFPSPMVFFFSVFTLAELYVSYRAARDVRTRQ
jgi:predicted neutral ceramidase superfamily lipid hydrolase